MLPTKSKIHGISSTLLACLCLIVLLITPAGHRPTSVLTETAASEQLVQIVPGKAEHRELAAGATEVFGVPASEGTLLRFSIDKGDLLLTTTVYDPRGARLLEHVSEDFEVIELSVPIDVSGTYRIELQSREKADTRRPYELKVAASTPLTPAGRRGSEAWQAAADAARSRAEWTEASLRQSIEQYENAASIWTSLGNLSHASHATLRSGDAYFLLSDYTEALRRYQDAATLAAKVADPLAQAKALSHIGRLESYIGKNDLAENHLMKALNLLGPVGGDTNAIIKNAYGEAVSNMGEVIYSRGNMVKASEQFKRALELLRGDRKGEAKAHLFAGYIAGSVGAPEKTIQATSEALKLYQAANYKSGEGLALMLLGLSHSSKRHEDRAKELHNKAIEIFQSIGDRHSEALAHNAVGQVYENLSEYSTALSHYEKSMNIFRQMGALDAEAMATYKVAKTYRLMKRFEQALTFYERCLQLSRSAKKLRTEALALTDVATVYAAQRSNDTLRQYGKLLNFYKGIGDGRGQIIALNAQGDFLLAIGKKAEAADTFGRAFALSEKIGDNGILIDALYNLARVERVLGHLNDAWSLINRSLQIIEELRRKVGSNDLRASYFSGVRKNYDLGINILMDLHRARPADGFGEQAFLLGEQSRARLLVDLIRESGAGLRQDAPQELVIRERELSGLMEKQAQYQRSLKLNGKNLSEVAEVENQIGQFRSEYQGIQARIREQNPRALSLAQFEPLTLAQAQSELRDEDMLLEVSLGEERSDLWVVTRNSFQTFELRPRKEIEELSIEVYKLLTARQQLDGKTTTDYQARIEAADKLLPEKSMQLSQMLFGQIADQLDTRRLVLVTEGALQLVPFAALPVPVMQTPEPKWLVLDHEIVQLPSIATLRAIRAFEKKDRDSANRIAAVIADPVFTRTDDRVQSSSLSTAVPSAAPDENLYEPEQRGLGILLRSGGLARLTHSSEEADAIAAAAPRGTTIVARGFEANRETAMSSRVSDYQILHFATHGFLDDEHPELSGIVLTMVDENGVDQNGVMALHDIYSLDLSAELTVLSACQTALGKDIKGEGLVGLSHSFISAGSRTVVSSLWQVDDRATASLMAEFYKSMLQNGLSPAAALRAAKLKMMQDKRWNAPYFWAGFVVQGEYTNHIAVENSSWSNFGVVILMSLLLASCGLIVFIVRRRRDSLFVRRT